MFASFVPQFNSESLIMSQVLPQLFGKPIQMGKPGAF